MTTKQVTVTKYIACDNEEFVTRSECEAHEREVRNLVEHELHELLNRKQKWLYAINKARIDARIAWLNAQELKSEKRNAITKLKYCGRMSDYWRHIVAYNNSRQELLKVRCKIRIATDNLYMWFGLHKKSSIARLERKKRSVVWRQEHTPDQWRTPNKIRVSKLPKEEQ